MDKFYKTKISLIYGIFKNNKYLRNGFSVVELAIVSTVASVIMLGISTQLVNQARANRALEEKLASLDVLRSLTQYLSVSNNCANMFQASNLEVPTQLPLNSTTISSTTPLVVKLKSLPYATPGDTLVSSGNVASAVSSTLFVESNSGSNTGIAVTISSVMPSSAKLNINFDSTRLIKPIKNLEVSLNLSLSSAGTNLYNITGCHIPGVGVGPASTRPLYYPPVVDTFAIIPQGTYPTVPGNRSPDFLSEEIAFTPVGSRADIQVSSGQAVHVNHTTHSMALETYFNQRSALDPPVSFFIGNINYWVPTGGNFSYGETRSFRVNLSGLVPGRTYYFRLKHNIICDPAVVSCASASTAMYRVWSPGFLFIQEYY